MDKIVEEDSIEKIWTLLFERVNNEGEEAGNTIELLNQHFVLTNMHDNLMFFLGRNLYPPFLITDFHDLLTGKNPGWALKWHPPSRKFCDQNGSFLGHYGERIRQNSGDQLLWCFKELQRNPDSRQAVLTYYNSALDKAQPYPPCTLSQTFEIRNGKLHTFVTMRSNDLESGSLYDWTHRALLTEHLGNWLNVEMGNYYHSSQSLHLYKNFNEINLTEKLSDSGRKIPKVGPISYDDTIEDIYNFDIFLHHLDDGFVNEYEFGIFHSELWTVWARVMAIFGSYHAKKWDTAVEFLAEIVDTQYFDISAMYFLKSVKKNFGTLKDFSFILDDIQFSMKFVKEFIK